MEQFNVNFYKFMSLVIQNKSAYEFERYELDEVHRICAYYGLWDEDGYGFDDRRNSVSNLIAAIQGIYKARNAKPGSEENFRIDYSKFMEVVTSKQSGCAFEDDEIDEIHRACAYHGLFDEENHGFSDRRNSVCNLVSTLQAMIASTSEMELKTFQELNDSTIKTESKAEPTREELLQTFHVKINNGPEQVIKTKTGIYHLVVSASLAMLDYEEASDGKNVVEIWCPTLLPTYGPYFYMVDGMQTFSLHENPFK
jgi:hypothetical protein